MAAFNLQPPKGTRDFYPEDMRLQNHIFDAWKAACRRHGFEEYEGPVFEHLELYTGKSGNEIVGQLYHFQDKGGRDLALRPELTPTFARMVNQKGPSLKLPAKWFSLPRLFRYEKAQRGRLREFFQLNMDIVGCDSLWAEVDLLAAIADMLRSFGLEDGHFRIGVSSRRLLAALLAALGVAEGAQPALYAALDKREKLPPEAFRTAVLEAGLPEASWEPLQAFFSQTQMPGLQGACRDLGDETTRPALLESLGELDTLLQRLQELGYGDCTALDLGVVRGLAYYTGIVFEVFDAGKTLRAIAGGGRYDNLLARLGGRQVSGVGFGMGDVVLAELLKERGLLPTGRTGPDYFIVSFEEGLGPWKLAQALRAKGRQVSLSLTGGKLKKQLAQADDSGAAKVIFYGSEKAGAGQVECKDLATGEQALVAVEDL